MILLKHKIFLINALAFLFVLCRSNLYGQITIQGVVTNEEKKPVYGISVVLVPENQNDIASYSLSDEKGFYKLNYTGDVDSLQLIFSGLGYMKKAYIISNHSQKIDVSLSDEPILLNEVIIKAPPIVQKGDTIKYSVASFAGKEDRTIGDVLKKFPGIEVLPDGQIKYNGKDIGKFYIENKDLLQGRYGIATQNISAQSVASVEVYENNQPIKALEKTGLDDLTAINLKLKDSSGGVLNAAAQLGIGANPSLLWENELTTLYFDKKIQNINTYKGNNTGNDVSRELRSLYTDNKNASDEGVLLSILAPSPPPINTQRYLFNHIHSVSSNLLHALPKEYELIVNMNYYNDWRTKDSFSQTSYFLSVDSILNVSEQQNSEQCVNNAEANINITANKSNFYLNNSLRVEACWNGEKGIVDSVNQQLQTNSYNVSNKFELIKTVFKDKKLRFYSFNRYARTPQNLAVTPGLYSDMLTNGQSFDKLLQTTDYNRFTSTTSCYFSTETHRFVQDYSTGIDINIQSLQSLLQTLTDKEVSLISDSDSFLNRMDWQKYRTFINARYSYEWRYLQVKLALPFSHNLVAIDDRISGKKQRINRLLFSPDISVAYDLNRKWKLGITGAFYNTIEEFQNSFTGYIMRDYRYFYRNDSPLADYKTRSYSLSANYRNILKAIFADVRLYYNHRKSNLLRDQNFVGTLQIQNMINKPVISKTHGAVGSIGKSIYALRSTVSLSSHYINFSSKQMTQGIPVDFSYSNYGFKPSIESQFSSLCGLSYAFSWDERVNSIENNTSIYPVIRSISNQLKFRLFPINGLSVTMGYEHYYNNAVSKGKYSSFSDLNVVYNWKRIDFSLAWSNIFNSKQYITSSYDATNVFVYRYKIRPSQILLTAKFRFL
jgi:hypothetical protein